MASYNGTNAAEEIRGGLSADYIIGGAEDDTLYGGGAIAVIGDGDDTIYGNTGNDLIYGNSGNDLIHGDQEGITFIEGFNDTVYGGLGQDRIDGTRGNDYIAGGGGIAHPVDDADYIIGGIGYDFILGNGGNDTIVGDVSADDTVGNDDIIYGGLGDDLIYGSHGYDAIVGQQGNDSMGGGIDKDTFFIFSNNGNDIILDFEDPDVAKYNLGQDRNEEWRDDYLVIEKNINGTGIDTYDELMAASTISNGNLVFNLGGGNSLTLKGVTAIGEEDVLWWDNGDVIKNYTLIYSERGVDHLSNTKSISYVGLDYYHYLGGAITAGADDGQSFGFYVFNEDNSGASVLNSSGTYYFQSNIDGSGVDSYEELMALATLGVAGATFNFPSSTFTIINYGSGDTIEIDESQIVFYDKFDYLS